MRVACARIPRFPLAVEALARPELRGRPVVLGGAPEERQAVVECSPEAERAGVLPGMSLREARSRCPDALFLESYPAVYADLFERMLDALERVSPIVEGPSLGCAFLDLTGLPGVGTLTVRRRWPRRCSAPWPRRFASRRAWVSPMTASPPGWPPGRALPPLPGLETERGERSDRRRDGEHAPWIGAPRSEGEGDTAALPGPLALEEHWRPDHRPAPAGGPHGPPLTPARWGRTDGPARTRAPAPRGEGRATGGPEPPPVRVNIIPPGEAAAFLARLPAHRMPLSEEMLRRLRWLGLRTAGDLAALPRAALTAQFGPEGALAWDLTQGRGGGPIVARRHPPEVAGRFEFGQPVTESGPVLVAVRHLLGRMLRRPEVAGRAARGLMLSASLGNGHRWQRAMTFREPSTDPERMLRMLAAKLGDTPFPAAVEALDLRLLDLCAESAVQGSLFTARARNHQGLAEAIEALHARFGRPLVMKIVGVEPWSRIPERQYALVPADTPPASTRSTARARSR
ncbi:MAG: hypothetical protein U0531_05510 [Dehalococcoidia bacterium]